MTDIYEKQRDLKAVDTVFGERPMVWQKDPLKDTLSNPKRARALDFYVNPDSRSYGNIKKSLLRAGYKVRIAERFLKQPPLWMKRAVMRSTIISQAETNLLEMTSGDFKNEKIKADMTKFALERLDRDNYGLKSKGELAIEQAEAKKSRVSEEGAAMIEALLQEYSKNRTKIQEIQPDLHNQSQDPLTPTPDGI